ncbi:MAG: hypothetical protein OEZ36_03840, partial [Spirochaetota bacterium]|nr:hypothetical protein [Spirochaetota bacterium]
MAKNYWLHRISHCSDVSHPLLEENYLSIGFADFCSDQILNTGFLTDWEAFEKEFERVSIDVWGCVKSHRSRFSLWRFVNSMKAGDWVIVPTYKKFHIYEIKSELLYPKDIDCLSKLKTERPVILNEDNLLSFDNGEKEHIDLGFFRKVKSIKNDISRYQFADNALFSRMKIRSTNANIVDIKESIEKVIKALENNRPISLFNDILNMS